jgi:hypothetical protein
MSAMRLIAVGYIFCGFSFTAYGDYEYLSHCPNDAPSGYVSGVIMTGIWPVLAATLVFRGAPKPSDFPLCRVSSK